RTVRIAQLRPAGESRFDAMAVRVIRDLRFEIADELRALGAGSDETHVTAQYVEDLRKFVDATTPQESADAGDARIVDARPHGFARAFGVGAHAAEFGDFEIVAVEAHALLPVEDWTAETALEPNCERSEQHHRPREEQQT